MNKRISNLKEKFFEAPESWSVERAWLVTEAFKKYESESYMAKRARAFENILLNKTIYIDDGELIVGNYAKVLGAYELYPEYSLEDQVLRYIHFKQESQISDDYIDPKERQKFDEVREYWANKNMHTIADTVMPEEIEICRSEDITGWPYGRDEGQGHISIEYYTVIHKGMRYIIDKAKKDWMK